MENDAMDGDSICCALTADRTVETICKVLNHYIPGYEKLPGDYGVLGVSEDITFSDEEEMLLCCVGNPTIAGSFFWNKFSDNSRHIMVGAALTCDGQLVMSVTVPATRSGRMEGDYLRELKGLINSDCGVVYSNQYPEFSSGADFRARYQKV